MESGTWMGGVADAEDQEYRRRILRLHDNGNDVPWFNDRADAELFVAAKNGQSIGDRSAMDIGQSFEIPAGRSAEFGELLRLVNKTDRSVYVKLLHAFAFKDDFHDLSTSIPEPAAKEPAEKWLRERCPGWA